MVVVSQRLINDNLDGAKLRRAWEFLEEDIEVQRLLRMSNLMVVDRMLYNDHGPVHSDIVTGSALEMLRILARHTQPTTIKLGIGGLEDAQIIVLCGAYLHDIGNSVHRDGHEIHGCYLAVPILNRLLDELYRDDPRKKVSIKTEILHSIYSHDEEIQCLSVEAGILKVADGMDMAEGRARVPYRRGKSDIHAVSALSIQKVEIMEGETKPIIIRVYMNNPSGIFQIQEVLGKKIITSGIEGWVEVVPVEIKNG